jgi:hydroxymethylglutaryl-CoA lyase
VSARRMDGPGGAAPPEVELVDVTLRDGLQVLPPSEADLVSTDAKVDWAGRLAAAGFRKIEVTNFGSPRRLPQFADAEEVVAGCLEHVTGAEIRAYVPNARGLERAMAAKLPHAIFLITCSESYETRNVGRSLAATRAEIAEMIGACVATGMSCSVGMGMCFSCPYEGATKPEAVVELMNEFFALGVRDIAVADSLGLAGPREIRMFLKTLGDSFHGAISEVGLHLHNLSGLAALNAATAIECGIRRFESTTTGIGGGIAMPVEAGMVPNFATEHALALFERLGYRTGVSRDRHAEFCDVVSEVVGARRILSSAVAMDWDHNVYSRSPLPGRPES